MKIDVFLKYFKINNSYSVYSDHAYFHSGSRETRLPLLRVFPRTKIALHMLDYTGGEQILVKR